MKLQHASGTMRLGSGLAAAALALAGLGFVAAPAYAAADVSMPRIWLTPGMNAQSPGRVGLVSIVGSDRELTDLTAVFDLTGLGNAVTVTPPADCTTKGTTVTCPIHASPMNSPGRARLELVFRAGPGAVAGTSVTLSGTVSGPNIQPLTGTGTVRILHGADMVPAQRELQLQGRSRDALALPLSFTNWGDRAADGFYVRIKAGYQWAAPPTGCERIGDGSLRCRVDKRVEAGGRYDGTPVAVQLAGVAPLTYVVWMEPLELPEPGLNYGFAETVMTVSVSGIPTDIAVEGATVSGEVGQTVEAMVTIRNLGPGDSLPEVNGGPPLGLLVETPPGTEIVSMPMGCAMSGVAFPGPSPTGRNSYECVVQPLTNGQSASFTLGLKITQKIPGAAGQIGFNPRNFSDFVDPNGANNRATLVVNPNAQLPVTGDRTAWFAAAGAVTVLVGTVLVVWTRRRRTVVLVAGEDEGTR